MISKVLIGCFFLFSPMFFAPKNISELGNLPKEVSETSGLIFYNGKLISHNDSGNSPKLFVLDTTTLKITRTVTLTNAENVDWEDIAQDEKYIYIGDIGNYGGDRKDLTIYRISKSDFDASDEVKATRIDFAYNDQSNFSRNIRSDWDAEALFVYDDQLVVLTKQWKSNGTKAYAIPKTPGSYKAKNIGEYNSEGMITGAVFNPITEVLYLTGYNQLLFPFLVRVDGLKTLNIFSGTVKRTDLEIGFAQVEGIAHVGENKYFFSSEGMSNSLIKSEARLFSFSTDDNLADSKDQGDDSYSQDQLVLYRNFGSDQLEYKLNSVGEVYERSIFDSSGRKVQTVLGKDLDKNSIDLSYLQSAIYYLTFYLPDGVVSRPFVAP